MKASPKYAAPRRAAGIPLIAALLIAALLCAWPAAGRAQGMEGLSISPIYASVHRTVTVVWSRPGSDGCYRQSGVATEVSGRIIRHGYRTWSEGSTCTEALKRGGFTADLSLGEPGVYQGEIRINGAVVATYALRVFPDEDVALAALASDLSALSEAELGSAIAEARAAASHRDELERALAALAPRCLGRPGTPVFRQILEWLQETQDLALVRGLEPQIRALPEPYGEAKWQLLARIGVSRPRPEDAFSDLTDALACPPGTDKLPRVSGSVFELSCVRPGTELRIGPYRAWDAATRKLSTEGEWRDGKKAGLWTDFDAQGNTWRESTYADGLLEGVVTEWESGAGGKPRTRTSYQAGEKNGEFLSYGTDGSLWLRGAYRRGAQHGQWIHYSKDGRPRTLETYAAGEKDGPEIVWDEHGEIETERTYAAGRLHGPLRDRSVTGSYARDVKTGVWRSRYRDGSLMEESNYVDGRLHGLRRIFHEGGKVKTAETLKAGAREGKREWFCPDGRRAAVWTYQGGRLVEERVSLERYPFVWFFEGAEERPVRTEPFWGYYVYGPGRIWLWSAAALLVIAGIAISWRLKDPARRPIYAFFFLPAAWALACSAAAIFVFSRLPGPSFAGIGAFVLAYIAAPFVPYGAILLLFAIQRALRTRFPFSGWSVGRFLTAWALGLVLLAGLWSFATTTSGSSRGPLRDPIDSMCDLPAAASRASR